MKLKKTGLPPSKNQLSDDGAPAKPGAGFARYSGGARAALSGKQFEDQHRVWYLLLGMAKNTFPTFVPPMMANSAKEPFDSPDWIFEVKLDGYRGIAVFDAAGKSHRWSRNGLSLEKKFPAVAKALSKLKLRSTRRSVRPARFHRQRKGPFPSRYHASDVL